VDAERKPLSGDVEVDEALVGGVQEGGKRGRGTTKNIVAIASLPSCLVYRISY
jgi:hypothetical protein